MSEAYRFEPLAPDKLDLLVPLMRDAFGMEVDRKLFDWKYRENPAGEAIGNIARAADGEVAAFYGMIPEIYRWGSRTQRIYQSCDTMTHSRHRRRGLFKKLALRTYEEAERADPSFYAFGFSGPMSTPGFLRMGWKIVFEVPHRFKPRMLCRLRLGTRSSRANMLERPNEPLFEMMQANESRRDVSKVYDRDYLRWRLDNPAFRYEFLVDDGAYAIFSRSTGFTFLVDFWETAPRAGRAIAQALDEIGCATGSKGLLTMCQAGGTMDRLVRRYWYVRNSLGRGPASATTPLITYGAAPDDRAEGASGWDIGPLDFDSY
jgi:hypothetical protein